MMRVAGAERMCRRSRAPSMTSGTGLRQARRLYNDRMRGGRWLNVAALSTWLFAAFRRASPSRSGEFAGWPATMWLTAYLAVWRGAHRVSRTRPHAGEARLLRPAAGPRRANGDGARRRDAVGRAPPQHELHSWLARRHRRTTSVSRFVEGPVGSPADADHASSRLGSGRCSARSP